MDIDIDVSPDTDIKKLFPKAVAASRVNDGELVQHPCGYYFENIPVDKLTTHAAIPHKQAAEIGYTKIDFLHLSLLNQFKSKAEFRKACRKQPDWSMLRNKEIVSQLFQIRNSFDIVLKISPTSIQELADTIALIRPDKRHLLNDYLRNKKAVRPLLYRSAKDDKSAFRMGHSLAYSVTIVAQLNYLKEKGA